MGTVARMRGAALVIALVLLLIVTLLATTGVAVSTTELVMASNEQFRRAAEDAASAGVELAIARLVSAPVERTTPLEVAGGTAAGKYFARARLVAEATTLPGYSAGRFAGVLFEIDSTGESARHATDEQMQGVLRIVSREGVASFTQRGRGLAEYRGGKP